MINFVPHLELDNEVPRRKVLHPKADNATPLHQNCQTMLKTDKFTRTSTMGKKNETQLNSSGGSVVNVSSRQEFYRPQQVAELLGISLRTYYTMVSRGKLHPVKLSERVTVVARKEILSMIEMALGETLSQSIFSKGKRNDCKGKSCKGKANEGAKTRRMSKGAAKDRAPVGVTHDTHIPWRRFARSSTTVTVAFIHLGCGIRFRPSTLSAPRAIRRRLSTMPSVRNVSVWAGH